MTDSQTPLTDAIVHAPESDLLYSDVYSANIAALIHVSRRLERDRADLIAALQTCSNDAEDVYQALARGEVPVISIGRWRRFTEARATLARVRP